MKQPKVALVSMPFTSVLRPSIQLGLLAAIARNSDWTADTMHLNIDFSLAIGLSQYESICQYRKAQIGDWLFSGHAFDEDPDPHDVFLERCSFDLADALSLDAEIDATEWIKHVRHSLLPKYLQDCASLAWSEYDVIGFSSTFQQNAASFALARLIKQQAPNSLLLFGGSNFDSDMGLELVQSVGCIDAAIQGEADLAFPALLQALSDGSPIAGVPGVLVRNPDGVCINPTGNERVAELDDLPVPDYAEYFARGERLGLFDHLPRSRVAIPFEGSRGCWWGERSHCVFCGLNGEQMSYRSKSPDRLASEILQLSADYRTFHLEAVDNIASKELGANLSTALTAKNLGLDIFYETKSGLGAQDIQELRDAGVRRIQPGIESLSTPSLRAMKKGATATQNLNMLRWCQILDVDVAWNLLWGVPGEQPEWITAQVELMGLLSHLQPPGGFGPLRLDRFSPMFTQRESLGIVDVRPLDSYQFVYPTSVKVEDVAYFFEFRWRDQISVSHAPLRAALQTWQQAWTHRPHPALTARFGSRFAQIHDSRQGWPKRDYTISGTPALLLKATFERSMPITHLERELSTTVEDVEQSVQVLKDLGLLIQEGQSLLALPTLEQGSSWSVRRRRARFKVASSIEAAV